MSTTVFATKRAVRDLLKRTPGLDGIQVAYADPGERHRTAVWLGPEVEDVEDEAVALKPKTNRRNEDYRIYVYVEKIAPGSVEDVENATEALVNAILGAVDDRPKLGVGPNDRPVPGLLWVVTEGMSVDTTETDVGPRVKVEIHLRVRAHP